ncbi:MAG: hypothetical protein NZ765_13175 [Anaerolineae bacterium]|nr:hypothetical protein [Anaerolineae bacterium]MDW8071254.1 hypothetical protein [Anaerolineae bacterium]
MSDADRARRTRWWARRAQPIGLGIGWLLAVSGATWAPWVERPAAALVLTAPDLAEFVKFLPEVRHGALAIQRLSFLAPLFLLTSGTPWIFGRALMPGLPMGLRVLARWLMLPLALLLLPPVWNPVVLISEEFRLQTAGCVLCLLLALLWRSHWHVPRPMGLLWALGWVAAPALALWQFTQAQSAIARAYAAPIVPGWGSWATLGGGLLMSWILGWGWCCARHGETRRTAPTGSGSR